MSDFAVEALNIVRTFKDGEVHALDDVTLHVPRSEVFGLLGPNGSGKTTMIRILSTILAPTSGVAIVNGYDVVKQPDHVRRSIGLAGQFATVDENLTGFENLRMVGLLNHLEKSYVVKRSQELLERFGLSDAAKTSPRRSSPIPHCSFSTNRRPALIPRVAKTSGRSSRDSSKAAPRCCSRRSTSKRPTVSASNSWSSTTARSSPKERRVS